MTNYFTQDMRYESAPLYMGGVEELFIPKDYRGKTRREGCYIWRLHHCTDKVIYVGRSDNIFSRLYNEWGRGTIMPPSQESKWAFIWNYFNNLMSDKFGVCNSGECDHIPRISCEIIFSDNSETLEKELIQQYQPLLNKRHYSL